MLLHSNIIGEGHPFIILHGFLGMGDNWKTLAKQFSGLGFELHLVDQRNHGRSFHANQLVKNAMWASVPSITCPFGAYALKPSSAFKLLIVSKSRSL